MLLQGSWPGQPKPFVDIIQPKNSRSVIHVYWLEETYLFKMSSPMNYSLKQQTIKSGLLGLIFSVSCFHKKRSRHFSTLDCVSVWISFLTKNEEIKSNKEHAFHFNNYILINIHKWYKLRNYATFSKTHYNILKRDIRVSYCVAPRWEKINKIIILLRNYTCWKLFETIRLW